MSEAASARARNLRTVGVLALLYLAPLALAFFAYYGTGWRPASHVNHGALITPPRPLPALTLPLVVAANAPPHANAAGLTLRGVWTLVYVGDGGCDADCARALLVMRQTRLGLNYNMSRVARLFLVSGACCERAATAALDPGLVVVDATGAAGATFLEQFPAAGRGTSVFVVDPLGNLMMSYDARTNPHGLLEDLEKLLRLSHIG
ncbi:MAG: hypothetical protein ACLPQ6_09210 [Steroidobacteraceae bacterium]